MEEQKTEIDTENENTENEEIEEAETEPQPLHCPVCDWKTHKNAKDKERGLRNHIRTKHPEQYKQLYPSSSSKTKKEIKILPPRTSQVIDEVEMIGEDTDTKKAKLVGDLDILKVKFADIPFNWSYTPQSSLEHLKRQKALFLRVLNDEAGTQAIFNLLTLSSKALEKVVDTTGLTDINGYADDVRDNKDEIYPILKNMVDTGVLDVGHLSSEMRLGMIMTTLAIRRMEANSVEKRHFLEEGQDVEN